MIKIFDSNDYTSCPHGRRYWDMTDDACRMCEYHDDCPLEPDDADDAYYDIE
jgi:hypothetical protein